MKKRIISGVIMAAVAAVVLALGLLLENIIITAFVAVIAGIAIFELVGNAAKIDDIVFKIISIVYTVSTVFVFSSWAEDILRISRLFGGESASQVELEPSDLYKPAIAAVITVVYVIICAILILAKQSEFDLSKIAVICGMPILYSFAFATISSVITSVNGIYYLLLILNCACVCDVGAYFVGVSYGKRKLCPEISPNKTVEGALGGIVSSIVVSLIITLCYGKFSAIIPTILLTIPLCVTGMVGDLFASVIKRKTGIKDYGNLIPGHGGVLDRVDSMLLIAPLVFCLMFLGVI